MGEFGCDDGGGEYIAERMTMFAGVYECTRWTRSIFKEVCVGVYMCGLNRVNIGMYYS